MGVVQEYLQVVTACCEHRPLPAEASRFEVIVRGRKPYIPLPTFIHQARPDGQWLASVTRRGYYLIVKRDDPILERLDIAIT